ncbi:MAG: shikimate kinase [Acidobacteriota bacterium]
MMKKDVIFLVGFMGCGKSAVGRTLANRLGYTFHDTDEMVEAKERRSIEKVFQESGEGYFREREWEALLSLAGITNAVVATGGGLFLGAQHRKFIKETGISIWLDAPFEDILERMKDGPVRPLFTDDAEFRQMLESRKGRYILADYRIDTRGMTVESIVDKILKISKQDFND